MPSADPVQFEGLSYPDLRRAEGLQRLDERFRVFLGERDSDLLQRLNAFRAAAADLPENLAYSQLLIDLAPHVEALVAALFGIEAVTAEAGRATAAHNPVAAFQQDVVWKRARRLWGQVDEGFEELDGWVETPVARRTPLRTARSGRRAGCPTQPPQSPT